MPEYVTHVNPHPPEILPPPNYRPHPSITKGPKRRSRSIVFGFLINYDDGRAWVKKTYGFELNSDHSQDLGIPLKLNILVKEKDMGFGCCPAPRRLELVSDCLIITQINRGPFIHDGPETYDEVLEEDLRPVPGVKEEQVKAWLEKEVGK